MSQYLIHKAVEFSKVKVAVRKAWGAESVDDLAGRFMAQRKYDGCNVVVIVTPNAAGDAVVSRTGEPVRSCMHFVKAVRQRLHAKLEKGCSFAVLGEAWRPGTTQNIISGEFRTHEPRPKLQLMAFDMLSLHEFDSGQSKFSFTVRYDLLFKYFRGAHAVDTVQLVETYNPGTYGKPTDMADALVKSGGFDGLILRDPDGMWNACAGTDGEIIKVKAAESHDLLVVGVEGGKGKYKDTLGALICQGPKGQVKVSGMTDAERDAWWANPALIIHAIVEVACLGFTPAGSLREPRFKGIRHDKEHADF